MATNCSFNQYEERSWMKQQQEIWLTVNLNYVTTFLVLSLLIISWYRSYQYRNMPPGPTFLELLLRKDFKEALTKQPQVAFDVFRNIYGGMFSLRFFSTRLVVLNDWKSIKECLAKQPDVFCGKPKMFVMEKLFRNTDIVSSSGITWRNKRHFVVQQLRQLGYHKSSTMEEIIINEVDRLVDMFQKSSGQEIAMKRVFHVRVINTLWKIVAGKTYDFDDEMIQKHLVTMDSNFQLLKKSMVLSHLPSLRFIPGDPFSFKTLLEQGEKQASLCLNIVREHVDTFRKEDPRDFVDVYYSKILEHDNKDDETNIFQKKHLIATLENLFTAVIKTTATTLEWAMLYMAKWPNIQSNVQRELDDVVGKNRKVDTADIPRLPYTQATIMEIQRYSSVINLGINCPMSTTKVCGHTIPKGTMILSNFWSVHHDKDLWKDPDIFRPERFIGEDGKVFKPEYFNPFSIGSRNCIGEPLARMQLHLFFARLLQTFTFRSVSGMTLLSLEPVENITLTPEPFSLVILPRIE